MFSTSGPTAMFHCFGGDKAGIIWDFSGWMGMDWGQGDIEGASKSKSVPFLPTESGIFQTYPSRYPIQHKWRSVCFFVVFAGGWVSGVSWWNWGLESTVMMGELKGWRFYDNYGAGCHLPTTYSEIKCLVCCGIV